MSASEPPEPSYQELAALVAGLAARVETLKAENAELRRRLGMNSANSSTPPSKDLIEAKATRGADRSSQERSKEPKPGGQPGHKGSLIDYCRTCSYLIGARNHDIRPIDAIHHALTANLWLPTVPTT